MRAELYPYRMRLISGFGKQCCDKTPRECLEVTASLYIEASRMNGLGTVTESATTARVMHCLDASVVSKCTLYCFACHFYFVWNVKHRAVFLLLKSYVLSLLVLLNQTSNSFYIQSRFQFIAYVFFLEIYRIRYRIITLKKKKELFYNVIVVLSNNTARHVGLR